LPDPTVLPEAQERLRPGRTRRRRRLGLAGLTGLVALLHLGLAELAGVSGFAGLAGLATVAGMGLLPSRQADAAVPAEPQTLAAGGVTPLRQPASWHFRVAPAVEAPEAVAAGVAIATDPAGTAPIARTGARRSPGGHAEAPTPAAALVDESPARASAPAATLAPVSSDLAASDETEDGTEIADAADAQAGPVQDGSRPVLLAQASPTGAPRGRAAPAQAQASGTTPAAAANVAGTAGGPALPLALPPPAADLAYELRRGPLAGSGRLLWRPAGSGASASYQLRLEARVPVLGLIFSETSSGGFDRLGLAPLRHTEKRLRKSERALSFTRDASGGGVLSFSASPARLPIPPGAQDRVSWLVQLSALVAGAIQTAAGGASPAPGQAQALLRRNWPAAGVAVPVASVHGDLRTWQFRLRPAEAADGGLLRLERRPPTGDYDTTAEVWLDPARHAWPVRLRLTEASGEVLELRLESLRE
jgi:hypothetical protein